MHHPTLSWFLTASYISLVVRTRHNKMTLQSGNTAIQLEPYQSIPMLSCTFKILGDVIPIVCDNCIPSSILGNEIPQSLVFKRPHVCCPSLSVWLTCFVHHLSLGRNKLSPRMLSVSSLGILELKRGIAVILYLHIVFTSLQILLSWRIYHNFGCSCHNPRRASQIIELSNVFSLGMLHTKKGYKCYHRESRRVLRGTGNTISKHA